MKIKRLAKLSKKQDDEISVLRKDLLKREDLEKSFSKTLKQFDKKLEKTVKLERAEAVKEFAERLKESIKKSVDDAWHSDGNGIYDAENVLDDIDNLVKEMAGEG